MDGFAVVAADLTSGASALRVVGTALAGHPFHGRVDRGEAVRIMTGAMVPEGADAVVIVERTLPGADVGTVVIEGSSALGENVRYPGEDVRQGEVVFDVGTVLGPAHIGALAGLGISVVRVYRRPRVGVLSTGDELVETTEALESGTIHDSNRPGLLALLDRAGYTSIDLGIAPDDNEALAMRLGEAAQRCDAILVSGGVSVGVADLVKVVLNEECGDSMRWMQIAIKPAKPFAFGLHRSDRTPVFGLPGNPVSALVSFELLARPALRKMSGYSDVHRPTLRAIANEPLVRRPDGKVHYARVIATVSHDGYILVHPARSQSSHGLSALADANALAVLEDGPGAKRGESVEILLLDADRLYLDRYASEKVHR